MFCGFQKRLHADLEALLVEKLRKSGGKVTDVSFICKTDETGEPLRAFFTHY
jgi:hypothetical protein